MPLEDLKGWTSDYKRPVIIAGPCSVETEEQLRQSIEPLQGKVNLFRGGVWKPRTRPGTFEGTGEEGLRWIQSAQNDLNIEFAVEVATPEHVELALKYDLKTLWIGARTTVNPFNVSELAASLKGWDGVVMVKNPIHPELSLWKGALERFHHAGVRKLGAIHRGFHSYQKSNFRNAPYWQIPLDLKSEFPDLPLICDPSHIGGDRNMIQEISQKAMDLNYDGLMIETHVDPDNAWSDAKQQVTPDALIHLLSQLHLRNADFTNKNYADQMEIIREQIDNADRELLEALALRMNLVDKIGEIKKENNVAIFQISRWKEIFKSRTTWGKQLSIDENFVLDLFRKLHQQSVKQQTELYNKTEDKTLDNG